MEAICSSETSFSEVYSVATKSNTLFNHKFVCLAALNSKSSRYFQGNIVGTWLLQWSKVWGVYCLRPLHHWHRGFECHFSAFVLYVRIDRGLAMVRSPIQLVIPKRPYDSLFRKSILNWNTRKGPVHKGWRSEKKKEENNISLVSNSTRRRLRWSKTKRKQISEDHRSVVYLEVNACNENGVRIFHLRKFRTNFGNTGISANHYNPYEKLNRTLLNKAEYVRLEVFTAVTMKNAILWDVAPCRSCVNRGTSVIRWPQSAVCSHVITLDFSTLKMEAIRSSETSVHTRSTRRHIPEDGSLQSRIKCKQLLSVRWDTYRHINFTAVEICRQ
jgi:hypothetical protein